MRTYLLRNGRVTGSSKRTGNLVKNKIVHAMTASYHWSSPEWSSFSAWYVHFGNGYFSVIGKVSSFVVRAVAALDDEYVAGWFDALDDCARHKKMSEQCVMYRLGWHLDILQLAEEVQSRCYTPSTSICFMVTRPKLREVFAANFRDRIVQHWLCLRLNPLFDKRFVEQGNVSFNCRKNFGTFKCVSQLAYNALEVSDGYTREAWYAQFDVQRFFMSIDCEILLKLLLQFIKKEWCFWIGTPFEPDLDLVLWLTEVIVKHRPQDNCKRQGNIRLWDQLAPSKSLFHTAPMRGEPIGNLTSQLFANFYMSYFDELAINEAEKYGAKYIRFVDDFEFVCKTKADAIHFKNFSNHALRRTLNIKMHPDKVYIQEVHKGAKMVGSVVKPGRTYLSNRTVGGFVNALRWLDEACERHDAEEVKAKIRSVNSYLGFLIHHQSYSIRRKAFASLKYFKEACYTTPRFNVVKLKKNVSWLL